MKNCMNIFQLVLLSLASLATTEVLASAPVPVGSINIGDASATLIGSEACFSVDFSNTGTDGGFGPYYRLILPPHLTLASATFLEQTLSTDALGVFPAAPGNQISDTRANDVSITSSGGDSLTNLVLPLSNVILGGPTITTDICLTVSTAAQLASPLSFSLQPILEFGDTATGDNGAIEGITVSSQITPTLMTFSSSNNAPAGKQVPGPTFALTYQQVIDVAQSQLVSAVALDEGFSNNLTFAAFNPVTPTGGTDCTYGAAPGSNATINCTSISGGSSDSDVTSGYSVQINDMLDQATCANQTITHNSTLDGTFAAVPLAQASSSNNVSVRHLTLTKAINPKTLSPGGTLTVSGEIRLSDFSTASSLSFVDQLPDGLSFASHGSLTLNGGGAVTITPTSIVNGDGSGTVTYDLSAVSGNIAGGSLINYSYSVLVDATYHNGDPLLASDDFTINGTSTYSLTGGASNCTDSHSDSLTITPVIFSTEIINPKAEYVPDEVVTFRLSLSIPSGDTANIKFTSFFPLPIFDVATVNTSFNNDVVHSPTDTLATTPTSISIDAATNALIIDWPDVSTASDQTLSVDVSVRITDSPFADNAFLTTLSSGDATNSLAALNSSIKPVRILVRNPVLSITSGLSAINQGGSLSLPGSSPPQSDAIDVDAGDTMTQVITITNDGGAPAHKIRLSQADLAGLTGYTLTGATLNGGDISGSISGALSSTLVIDNAVSLPKTQNIVLTYTYQLAQTAKVTELLQPEASVVWSASVASATAFPAQKDPLDITMADISMVATATAVSPQGNSGKLVVGDVVTYQASVTIPEGTVTDLVVDFALPPGLEYVAASSGFPAGFVGTQLAATETTTGVVATGQTRTFTFTGDTIATNNNNAGDNILVITLDAKVIDDAANAATASEQSKTLTVSATYQGAAASKNDDDNQAFTEHQLAITTTVAPDSNLQAGDSATVTFVVNNTGTAPAYDVVLSNVVDSDLFDLTSVATGSAGCNYANPNFSCNFASIATGGSQTVSYTATVQADVATGANFTVNGVVTGDSQSGAVAGQRSQSINADGNAASQALSINALTVIASSETFTSTAAIEPLAVGETVTYELVVDIPEGISKQTSNNNFISFTLPAGLQYLSNSALLRGVYDSSINSVTLASAVPTSDTAITPIIGPDVDSATSIAGQQLSFNLGNIDNNDDDANVEQVIVTITALVLNTDTNTPGVNLVTTGAVNYLNQAAVAQSDSSDHSAKILLPALAMTHTVTPGTAQGGSAVTYTLTVSNTNNANSTNGYDWSINGTVPALATAPTLVSAVLSRGSIDISGCASFTGNALSVDGSCLAGGQQGSQHFLAVDETITVVYQATIDVGVGFEQTIDNTMDVTITSLPGNNGAAAPGAAGSDKGERVGNNVNNDSGQAVNDLVIMATATVISDAPSLSLTASVAQAAVIDEVILTANFSVPVGVSNNFTYNLDLPTGFSYQDQPIVITLPAGNFTATLTPGTTPGVGTDPIALNFGTITNSAGTAQAITVAVPVVVDNIIANQNTTALTATAGLSYTGMVTAPSDTAVVTVIEANLTINQLITAGNVASDAGDTISYQVTVANTAASATAYRVSLSELLPAELLGAPDGAGAGPVFSNIAVTNPANAIVLSGTATPLALAHSSIGTTTNSNDTLSFSDFDLPAGVTLTYRYDVVVANSAVVGASVNNSSRAAYNSAPSGSGRSGSAGNDDDNDASLNNYYESATSTLVLASNIAVQHNLTTGQPDANFGINETVNFDLRVDLVEGKTNTVKLQQVLDSGLVFVSASMIAQGHISFTGAGTATESPSGTIVVDLGDVSNTADSDTSNDYLIWRVVTRINDDNANIAGKVLNANGSTTSAVGDAGPVAVSVAVVEPNLAVTITPSSATTSLGDEVTFTVLLAHNSSGADAFDTVVKLAVASGFTYVPGSFSGQGNLDDSNASLLSINLSSIALGDSSKTFSFRAKVDNNVQPNTSLTVSVDNTSSYSATSGTTTEDRNYSLTGSGATTVSAPSFIDAQQLVTLVNDGGNGVADGGETLQYTIVLTNNGPNASNVTYHEVIPSGTTLVAASLTSSFGGVTETGDSDLLANIGNMNSNDSVTISYQVVINPAITPGSDIVAQGSVDSDQTISELSDSDGNEANGDQATIITVGGQPMVLDALYVQQLADWRIDADANSNVSPGDTLSISYLIQNRGDSPLTNVSVADVIANGLSYIGASASVGSGTIDVTGSNITINLANLDSGAQVLASVELTIDNPLFNSDAHTNAETFVMQAAINSNETNASLADQNGIVADGNQPAEVNAVNDGSGTALPAVNQLWTLTGDVDGDGLVDAGDTVTYWLSIVNLGAATATTVNLTEVIPANTSIVSGSVVHSQGVEIAESPVNVNLFELSPGQLVTVSYSVTVDASTTDGTVIAAQADLSGSNFANVQSDDNGLSSDGINPTLFTVNNGATSLLLSTLQLTSSSDNSTTGNDYFQAETLTLQASFTIPAGSTEDLVLSINIPNGLVYQSGSAVLNRVFNTGLTASHDPATINTAASGATVAVDSLLSTSANTVSLVLGTVVNSDNDADDEQYQLTISLTSTTSIPTASSNAVVTTAAATYLNNFGQSKTSSSTNLTLRLLNRLPLGVNDIGSTDEDTAVLLTLLSNDSDVDNGQSLSISAVAAGANGGSATIAADGNSVSFTPASDFVGSDNFVYTLQDSAGGTSTATATITVTAINDAPVAANDTATINEDSTNNTIPVLTNDSDVDGDSLTVTNVSANNGTVTINGDNTLNYTPDVNFNGTDSISYTISDGNGGTATATVTVTVNGVNDAPVAVNDSISVGEDSINTIVSVLNNDSDLDGDSLTVTAVSATNGIVTINSDGTLNYRPNADFNGSDIISYTISDGNGGTATATVAVTVTAASDAPVAANDTATVTEDSTTNTITVLANDSDTDGDSLTVTAVSAANGTVTINGDGTLNYIPNADFNGTDSISYTISDGNGGTATGTVTVTVNGVNDLPVVINDTASVSEDSTNNIVTVLNNDSDLDGDSLTVTTVSATHGTVTINSDGTLNYRPDADFNGSDTISYTISDGNGGTATATVAVTVNGVNDAPVAANDTATVTEDSTSNTITVLANDSDTDGDSLTVTTVSAANGTVTINGDGTLNYIPNADFNGTDSISYTISDGNGGTVTATVTVTVNGVNDAPVAVNDSTSVSEDSTNNIVTVLSNDSDLDGDSLTVTAVSATNGTVTINADGTLNYRPNADFNGSDTISYTISDGNSGTATATVTVTVNGVNDAPVAVNDSTSVSEDSTNNIVTVLSNDSDLDGDSLTVTAVSATNGTVTINADGTLNYRPNADFNGSDTISYTISDGNGGTATATVAVTVNGVNDAPVAANERQR